MRRQLSRLLSAALPKEWPFKMRAITKLRPYIAPFEWVLAAGEGLPLVVDIGCGSGGLSFLLLSVGRVGRVVGIDPDPIAVARAQMLLMSQSPPLDFKLQVAESPVAIAPDIMLADAIVMCDVLHHIPADQQRDFLRQIASLMKPGAKFIIKDIDASRRILVWFNRLHDWIMTGARGDERTISDVVSYLSAVDLTIESCQSGRRLWYPHYQIVFIKNSFGGLERSNGLEASA